MIAWPTAALGELFDIARGGSPRPINDYITDDPDGVNWISISDATESAKFIRSTKRRIKTSGVSRSRMVHPGDFLLTNSMSFGRPYIMATSGCIHDGWLSLSPKQGKTDPDYLFHILGSPDTYRKFERLAAGATVKNLNIDLVSSVEIPLPPLDEQLRIAATLDQADALRRKRREGLQSLTTLKWSIFRHLFGDPAFNPMDWPIMQISELTASSQYGSSAKAGTTGDFPMLRMGNLTYEGDWALADLKYVDLPAKDVEKFTARRGDILFNRTNSPDLVGKTAVFRESEPYAFAGYLVRLRVNTLAHPEYVSAYLNSSHGKATLRGMCKSIIGMANINARELGTICLPVPPIERQREFANQVEAIRAAEKTQRAHLTQLDALFAALQDRAFRGEL